jgi:hypothetical protein
VTRPLWPAPTTTASYRSRATLRRPSWRGMSARPAAPRGVPTRP